MPNGSCRPTPNTSSPPSIAPSTTAAPHPPNDAMPPEAGSPTPAAPHTARQPRSRRHARPGRRIAPPWSPRRLHPACEMRGSPARGRHLTPIAPPPVAQAHEPPAHAEKPPTEASPVRSPPIIYRSRRLSNRPAACSASAAARACRTPQSATSPNRLGRWIVVLTIPTRAFTACSASNATVSATTPEDLTALMRLGSRSEIRRHAKVAGRLAAPRLTRGGVSTLSRRARQP